MLDIRFGAALGRHFGKVNFLGLDLHLRRRGRTMQCTENVSCGARNRGQSYSINLLLSPRHSNTFSYELTGSAVLKKANIHHHYQKPRHSQQRDRMRADRRMSRKADRWPGAREESQSRAHIHASTNAPAPLLGAPESLPSANPGSGDARPVQGCLQPSIKEKISSTAPTPCGGSSSYHKFIAFSSLHYQPANQGVNRPHIKCPMAAYRHPV